MSDSYDDYESKMQLAEHAWEVKTEHDRAVELAKAYERGWNAALAQQEPVAEIQAEDMGKPFNAIRVTVHFYAEVPAVGTKLYKAPPKREWVGLTDEEVNELVARFKRYAYVLLREVEAKLKEKNHG
jgi:hypothetical protein